MSEQTPIPPLQGEALEHVLQTPLTTGHYDNRRVKIEGDKVFVVAEVALKMPYCGEYARLFAAAPDMLGALRALLFQVLQGQVFERDACVTQARAAICKAQGVNTVAETGAPVTMAEISEILIEALTCTTTPITDEDRLRVFRCRGRIEELLAKIGGAQ